MSSFMLPMLLHIILSFKGIYHKVINEARSKNIPVCIISYSDKKLSLSFEGKLSGNNNTNKPTNNNSCLFLHTSGTTSRPKGVPLKHKNLLKSLDNIVNTYDLSEQDIAMVVMPLFHVHGLIGVALSKLKVFSLKETFIYSLIRVLVGPIIGFAFVKYFNLTGVEAGVMFIQASMPSAVLTYLVGKMYSPKKITDSIASTVALSTFLSLFTLENTRNLV